MKLKQGMNAGACARCQKPAQERCGEDLCRPCHDKTSPDLDFNQCVTGTGYDYFAGLFPEEEEG